MAGLRHFCCRFTRKRSKKEWDISLCYRADRIDFHPLRGFDIVRNENHNLCSSKIKDLMNLPLRILLVEDSENDAQLLLREIRRGGYDVVWERVETRSAMEQALARQPWDIISCDNSLPQFSALEAIRVLKESSLDIPLIIISGTIGEEAAVAALKAGAHDFLVKGKLARLIPAIQRELQEAEGRRERRLAWEAQQRSEERYRTIFESAAVAIMEQDFTEVLATLNGLKAQGVTDFRKYFSEHPEASLEAVRAVKVLDVNQQSLKLFGAAVKIELRHSLDQVFLPETLAVFVEELVTLAKGGQHFETETAMQTMQGERRDVLLTIQFPEPGKKLDHTLVTMMDITERKQAEDRLKTSEASYRRLFEAAKDGILILDANTGEIRDVNPFLQEMLGYPTSEFLGKQLWELVFFKDIAGNKESFRELQEKGYIRYENLPLQTKDGDKIFVEFVSNSYDVNGRRVIQCNIRDITQRKEAEAALARSEQDYRTLFENMPIGLYRTSAEGLILDANYALAKLFGYKDRESLIGKNIVDFYVDRSSNERFKGEIEKSNNLSKFETEYRRLDGTTFWTEDHARIVRKEAGEVLYYEGSLIDITKRRRAEELIQQQLKRLNGLRTVDIAISSNSDIRILLDTLLLQVVLLLKVDAAAVLLFNPSMLMLEYAASLGIRSNAIRSTQIKIGEGYAGRAVLERQTIHISDLLKADGELAESLKAANEDFVDYYGVPLIAKGEVKGVLEIYHRSALKPDKDWLDFLETLARQGAIGLDNVKLFDDLQRSNMGLALAYDATIEGWSRAMDLRDKETEGHTLRVTEKSLELARRMGFSEDELVHVRRGALLHDIGKIGVPDNILLKADKLTDEEWVIMRKHPTFAYELISPIQYLKAAAVDIPYCHHEKWDGTGYPRGLKGEQIPLVARIFAIVDVWDALTSDRPYRPAWSKKEAIEYIHSLAGTHFDPQVVEAFLKMQEQIRDR